MSGANEHSAATNGSTPFTRGPYEIHHVPGDVWEVTGQWGVPIAEVEQHGDAVILGAAFELAAALRELHDFAEPSLHHRYAERSRAAFERAAELLKRVGA